MACRQAKRPIWLVALVDLGKGGEVVSRVGDLFVCRVFLATPNGPSADISHHTWQNLASMRDPGLSPKQRRGCEQPQIPNTWQKGRACTADPSQPCMRGENHCQDGSSTWQITCCQYLLSRLYPDPFWGNDDHSPAAHKRYMGPTVQRRKQVFHIFLDFSEMRDQTADHDTQVVCGHEHLEPQEHLGRVRKQISFLCFSPPDGEPTSLL